MNVEPGLIQPWYYWIAGGLPYYLGYTGLILCSGFLSFIYAYLRGSWHGRFFGVSKETSEQSALIAEEEALFTHLGMDDHWDEDIFHVQKGFKRNPLGKSLLYLFYFVVALSNIILFLLSAFAYEWILAHHPDTPAMFPEKAVQWSELAYSWLYVCVVYHGIILTVIHFRSFLSSFALNQCSLREAEFVKIESKLDMAARKTGSQFGGSPFQPFKTAYLFLTHPPKSPELVPVQVTDEGLRFLTHTVIRYLWDEQKERFVSTGYHSVAGEKAHELRAQGGLNDGEVGKRLRLVGLNQMFIDKMSISQALSLVFLTFLNLFQGFATWQYFFLGSWNLAILYFVMMLLSGLYRGLFIVRRNQHKTADMALLAAVEVQVLRSGRWSPELTTNLVYGDILRIQSNSVVTCDILLLEGVCVTNESGLTGESLPVRKVSAAKDRKLYETGLEKSIHVLYSGTTVMTSTSKEGEALGYVLATGARSVRGSMMRSILFPPQTSFAWDQDLGTVYTLLLVWVIIQMIIMNLGTSDHETAHISVIMVGLASMVQSLSPLLPVVLSLGVSTSVKEMEKNPEDPILGAIGCTLPDRLPVAAKVDVAVFDKTGTVTEGGMIFKGIFLDGKWIPDVFHHSQHLLANLALNHMVTQVDSQLIGNEVEVSVLKALDISVPDVSHPRIIHTHSGEYSVIKANPFDNVTQLSSVVARDTQSNKVSLFAKGSVEAVAQICQLNIKHDARILEKGAYYALGLCTKALDPHLSDNHYWDLPVEDLIKGAPLTFQGFSCFSNGIKSDSPECFRLLKEGNIKTLICSGDAVVTCIQIGSQVGLFEKPVVEIKLTHRELVFINFATDEELDPVRLKLEDYEFAVSSEAMNMLESQKLLGGYLMHIRVFGRMKPNDKVALVRKFQQRQCVTSMCGDGANDTAALRVADVGLALTEGDASLVAAFSTSSPSLLNFVRLLTFGRSTLVSSIALFTVSVTIGLMMTTTAVLTHARGDFFMAEWHYVLFDVTMALGLTFTMTRSGPLNTLAKTQPTSNLLGLQQFMTVLGFLGCYWIFFLIGWFVMHLQDFYVPFDSNALGIPTYLWMKKGDNYDTAWSFLMFTVSLSTFGYVLSYGGVYRQNVLKNYTINLLYLGSLVFVMHLLWAGPSNWHCWWRVQCDQSHARNFFFPLIEQLSVGDPKGCVLNAHAWYYNGGDPQTPHPQKSEFIQKCLNPHKYGGYPPSIDLNHIPEKIRASMSSECDYPNTCFPTNFKLVLTGLLAAYILSLHLYYKYVIMKPQKWVERLCFLGGFREKTSRD